jgi:dihydroxyacetone kinase-like predicted kinase
MRDALTCGDLRAILSRLDHTLAERRDELDALNIFPVADRDTGANLAATAHAVCEHVRDSDDEALVQQVPRAALLSARGNSGLILSQLLGGLAAAFADRGLASGSELVAGLRSGADAAAGAFAEPVEGTGLSAARAAAESGEELAAQGADLAELSRAAAAAAHEAVVASTGKLEALQSAGVVDAGALGVALFCDAIAQHTGAAPSHGTSPEPKRQAEVGPSERANQTGAGGGRFEVQYLLAVDDAHSGGAAGLRGQLSALGDSVGVAQTGERLRVHVHTDHVGAVIEAGLGYGHPSGIEVTDLDAQSGPARGSESGVR